MFLYPSQCRHCGETLDATEKYICERCWSQVEVISGRYCQRCGHPLGNVSISPPSCKWCLRGTQLRKVRAAAQSGPVLREALNLLKFQGKLVIANRLADIMIEGMARLLDVEDYDLIVPVPLHKRAKRKRSYNQVEIIGRRLSRATGIPMDAKALIKVKDIPRQSEAAFRFLNVRGSFDVPDPSRVQGKGILLIDDIFISGSTVNEACKTLAKARPKFVDVLTLARRVDIYPKFNALENWLYEHFQSLPLKAQDRLERLRDGARQHSAPEDYEEYLQSEHWKEFSFRMRRGRLNCEVCSAGADQVHHLHYKSLGKEKPTDVVVLCDVCHSFVHPMGKMAIQAFERQLEGGV